MTDTLTSMIVATALLIATVGSSNAVCSVPVRAYPEDNALRRHYKLAGGKSSLIGSK